MREAKLVFVGELNPYGSDPEFALYHQPRGASGDRLRVHLGLRDATYARIPKINLCTGSWSMRDARARSRAIIESFADADPVLVLLGAKVRLAFDVDVGFFSRGWLTSTTESALPGFLPRRLVRTPIVVLPHPSGRCLLWNAPGARERARDVLRAAFPAIAWGETDLQAALAVPRDDGGSSQ